MCLIVVEENNLEIFNVPVLEVARELWSKKKISASDYYSLLELIEPSDDELPARTRMEFDGEKIRLSDRLNNVSGGMFAVGLAVSQLDSPLPGPADIVGGVVVVVANSVSQTEKIMLGKKWL